MYEAPDYFDDNGRFVLSKFWDEKVRWALAGDRTESGEHCIRIGGEHWVAMPGICKSQGGLGYGGRMIGWRELATGKEFESNHVWHLGEIPETHRDLLPVNAIWTKGLLND